MDEQELIAAGRGKWSKAGVPHKGWQCVEIEDLGAPDQTCEMCEARAIRYVHYMAHPKFNEVLAVGCVCAGHMEGDLPAARIREASMLSRAGKRKRWTTRKWKVSQKGNPTITADGFRVTIYKKGIGFGATVAPVQGEDVYHLRRVHRTANMAKLAGFDFVTRLLQSD
ncbi:hypothetical protein [Arenimonas alkanexedens]